MIIHELRFRESFFLIFPLGHFSPIFFTRVREKRNIVVDEIFKLVYALIILCDYT